MKKATRFLVNILTFLTLVLGTITIMQSSVAIVRTSAALMGLNDIPVSYDHGQLTEKYLEDYSTRNSDNIINEVFNKSNQAVKIGILVWALASFVLIPLMWLMLGIKEVARLKYRAKKKQARKRAPEVETLK